jgi:hypothetical protein
MDPINIDKWVSTQKLMEQLTYFSFSNVNKECNFKIWWREMSYDYWNIISIDKSGVCG